MQGLVDKLHVTMGKLEGDSVRRYAADVSEPWQAVLDLLMRHEKESIASTDERVVLAAAELTPQVVTFLERERILGDAAAAARESTRMEQDAYRVGKSDLRAVNQRQLAQWAAEVALLNVQRERLVRRIDLHLALGGSFGETPLATAATDPPTPLSPDH